MANKKVKFNLEVKICEYPSDIKDINFTENNDINTNKNNNQSLREGSDHRPRSKYNYPHKNSGKIG